jgi:SAM-dependent methyltransferase
MIFGWKKLGMIPTREMYPSPKEPPTGQGVRKLGLAEQRPNCRIVINRPIYSLKALAAGQAVVDIGCGYGRTRAVVESVGGTWTGVEPFPGGGNTVTAAAEQLPFHDASFDLVIMDAVLEHLNEVEKSFAEVARILKPGGTFVGYSAFMECFHEISYYHISFKGIEHLARKNGLVLTTLGGGGRFGIDHHLGVLLYPLPFQPIRPLIAGLIRSLFYIKSLIGAISIKFSRGLPWRKAWSMGRDYYELECLRQSIGFDFVIEKPAVPSN